MMGCVFCLAWSLALASPPATDRPERPLTFREALAVAREQNGQLRASEEQVQRAQASREEKRGLYFPTISALGAYGHMNDRLFVDLNGVRPYLQALNPAVPLPPLTATVLDQDPFRLSLLARWTVFTGGRIVAANRAAEAGVTAASQQQLETEHALVTEVATRYFGRRLAADVLEVRRASLETLTRHLEDARRLKREGQIARTDELRAEVARAEAERDFKKAGRDVELASVALASSLGADMNVIPTTPLAFVKGLEPRESFAETAPGNPSIQRLGALRLEAHEGVAAARGEIWPTVILYGTYELVDSGLNSTADPKWIVGVLGRWELFDGLARYNRRKEAQHLEAALASEQSWAQQNVGTLVQQRYDEYQSALEQYESLETTQALAQESLRAETKAFEAGVGTSLAVVDAQLALSRVQVGRLTALRDLGVALAQLLEASAQSDRLADYVERATPGGQP